MNNIVKSDRIILALDFPDFESCKKMIDLLGEEISFYKIGLEIMMSGDFFKTISYLKGKNKKVFADLKLHDITKTIERTIVNLRQYDIDLLTIHTGDRKTMQKASEVKGDIKLLAVTVLTCHNEDDLLDMGYDKNISMQDLVLKKAKLAIDCKIDGVVSSALETEYLRNNLGSDFLIATPGIRLESSDDDQKRVTDAKTAIKLGSSHLVIGRPITRNENPLRQVIKFKNNIEF